MKVAPKLVVVAGMFLGAAACWLADATADSLLFGHGSFWDVLVVDVSAQEALGRGTAAILVVCIGALLARYLYSARCSQVNRKLHESEDALARYEDALDGLEDLVAVVDRAFTYVFANESYLRQHNVSREDIIGRTVADLHGKEAFETEMKPHMEQCFQGKRVRREALRTDRDDQDSFLEVTYYPLSLGEGPPAGMLILIEDMSESRRQEEALHRQRHFDWSIMEAGQVVIVLVDTEGRVARLNRFGQELTGYSEDEVRGKDCFEIATPANNRALAREGFKRVLAGEPVQGLEAPVLTKDGRTILIRWYGSLLDDPSEKIIGVVGVGHDITEVRDKENQLHRAARMEALGRLAGGIAHDFNNVLAVVQGHAEILARSPLAEDEASAEDILEIRDAARRGAKLTEGLLAFGRRRMAEPRVIQLNQLILSMESMLRWTLGDEIHLDLNLARGLRHVRVDPGQMEEAIVNLAINGRDAMPKGGRLSINTGTHQVTEAAVAANAELPPAGEYVAISVTDNGMGMDEGTRRRVFEPFFTTKGDGKGTGLGLATCHGIVRQSGGRITVTSKPGKGSTFCVFLPATDEPIEEPLGAVAEEDIPVYPLRDQATILLVEDDGPMRRMLGRAMRKAGFGVIEAVHDQYAMPLAEHLERNIDVLVTDVILPYMDGVEMSQRIRAVRPDINVVYISGRPEALDKVPPEAEFLPKPFTTDQLVKAIWRVLAC